MGLSPLDILVTKEAYDIGLGEADLSRIEIAGDSITDFIIEDFKLPQTIPTKLVPKGIAEKLGSLVTFRPYIDSLVCRRCNLCKITCPVYAISTGGAQCRIDYSKCVRCLCCHEVCPYRAITIRRNIITRLIWG
jgi:Pyruvate/2-oxoacid:ferredoxin oxidoreductase delta subunit